MTAFLATAGAAFALASGCSVRASPPCQTGTARPDGGAAGCFGHHALLLPDLVVEAQRLHRLRHRAFGVAMAHAVRISPYAVVLILVALTQVDRRIDLAARAARRIGTRTCGHPAEHPVSGADHAFMAGAVVEKSV